MALFGVFPISTGGTELTSPDPEASRVLTRESPDESAVFLWSCKL